jgi:hypothetical protein
MHDTLRGLGFVVGGLVVRCTLVVICRALAILTST